MKYFLIAGEASGDMHGAHLMEQIKEMDQHADFMFFGGDMMSNVGGKNLKHYREMAFMGIIPVILNLRAIKQNLKFCKESIFAYKPDTVILIDYPGFNLRIAEFAKKNNIKTCYYISPKIWAWKTKRIKKIKAYVDHMFSILPFEESFYKNFNYPVEYVGNPSWDIIKEELETPTSLKEFCDKNHLPERPIIALLPGSRKHEIKSILSIIQELKNTYPNHHFIVGGAPGIDISFYQSILRNDIKIVFNQTYKLLRNSEAAIVTSGTATLETALLSVPQVVVYKMGMGWLLERVRKYLLKTEFFSLVNLVAEEEVVLELFQSQVTVDKISTELHKLLNDESYKLNMLTNYTLLQEKIDSTGAAQNTALKIVKHLKSSQ